MMLKFGEIEIPEAFFNAMVEETALANLHLISEQKVNKGNVELRDQISNLDNQPSVLEALGWLIRIHTHDFTSSEIDITRKPEYRQIDDVVEAVAKERTYQLLSAFHSDDVLIQSAGTVFETLERNRREAEISFSSIT